MAFTRGLVTMESYKGHEGALRLQLPATDYLKSLYEEYNLMVSFDDYFVEVSRQGYREAYLQGMETGVEVKVWLEPKEVVYVAWGEGKLPLE